MRILLLMGMFCICSCGKPENELADMTKQVTKTKTGVDIRVTPLEEEKPAVNLITKTF